MAEPGPDCRAALPGDDAPPLAGKPWRMVKLVAWSVAGALVVGVAAAGAVLVGPAIDRAVITASA